MTLAAPAEVDAWWRRPQEDQIVRHRIFAAAVGVGLALLACTGCGSTEPAPASTEPTVNATTTTSVPSTTTVTAATTVATTTTIAAPTTTIGRDPERTLPVPESVAPAIDGVVRDGEWDRATVGTMTDGSSVLWMRHGRTLYLAVDGSALGAVNLALAIDDEIWFLHSSAALGSARYQRSLPEWTLAHGFSWCCRSATDSTARLALLEEEGWQANIGFTGDEGVVEYQVDLPWNGALAAVSFQTESADPAFWPEDLTAAAREDLVGPPPDTRSFDLNEWYTLEAIDV